jgi:long-chain acyl-CoA synthetase
VADNTVSAPIRNVADLVRRAADHNGGSRALVFRGTVLTWSQLDSRVSQAAAALRGLGLDEGDRVAIALPNGLDFPVVYFGALRAGLVALPVNPAYTGRELAHVLGDSRTVAVVGGPGVAAAVQSVRDQLPTLRYVLVTGAPAPGAGADRGALPLGGVLPGGAQSLTALLAAAPTEAPTTERGDEDLAVLIYTSGTSGKPKGAMLSHRAMLANLEQCSRIEPPVLSREDVVLLVLPLFHVYGLNPGLGQVAWEGCTAVLVERFDPTDTLGLIRRHGVTNVPGAPPMYVAWSLLPDFPEAFAQVRVAISGADQLPADAQHRLHEATGRYVFEGYGLTETAPVLTSTLMSDVQKVGSIGQPIPGVELRLLDVASGEPVDGRAHPDEDDEDDDVHETADPGEIAVRGDNLFSGYWPDGEGGPDAEGWWRTGDVAYADEDGDLFLVDRIKELILVSGFNVYPREVEDVLVAHPGIAEAAVIGAPHPYTGETVKAYVVTEPGVQLTAEDVIGHCERALARFKCPTAVEFVAALPHSATGKVSKGRLRAAARRGVDPSGI